MLSRVSQTQNWPVGVLAIYSMALVTATHWPSLSLPQVYSFQDKLLHLACYAGFGLLAYWALVAKGWLSIGARSTLTVALLASSFGAIDEVTQFLAPGRVVDVLDWVANTCGGVLGAAIFQQVVRFDFVQKLGVGGR